MGRGSWVPIKHNVAWASDIIFARVLSAGGEGKYFWVMSSESRRKGSVVRTQIVDEVLCMVDGT